MRVTVEKHEGIHPAALSIAPHTQLTFTACFFLFNTPTHQSYRFCHTDGGKPSPRETQPALHRWTRSAACGGVLLCFNQSLIKESPNQLSPRRCSSLLFPHWVQEEILIKQQLTRWGGVLGLEVDIWNWIGGTPRLPLQRVPIIPLHPCCFPKQFAS